MPKICYIDKKFHRSSMEIINTANDILEEYEGQGFVFTLRQLYYQFVARDLVANNQKSYDRLGSILNDARLAGLINWNHLQDRTRNLQSNTNWKNPMQIISAARSGYRLDKWENQKVRPEVWIEKDALIGVIEDICYKLDVDHFSCRGYVSQSEMWNAGQRLESYLENGQTPIIFHLGDHDPSGIDMTRDIKDRLELFTDMEIQVERLALHDHQIKKYKCPPNPVKLTDSRAKDYRKQYGDSSWELDALEPSVIVELVETNVLKVRNNKKFKETVKKEDTDKNLLLDAEAYVESLIEDQDGD